MTLRLPFTSVLTLYYTVLSHGLVELYRGRAASLADKFAALQENAEKYMSEEEDPTKKKVLQTTIQAFEVMQGLSVPVDFDEANKVEEILSYLEEYLEE